MEGKKKRSFEEKGISVSESLRKSSEGKVRRWWAWFVLAVVMDVDGIIGSDVKVKFSRLRKGMRS
jgi:hypothetical protein